MMYGLPADFDGKILIGRNLEQVSFTENQILLNFDRDVSIDIGSAFSHRPLESIFTARTEVPVTVSDLMWLLGRSVSDASGDDEGTLRVRFDNGHIVEIFDTSPQYESYQIRYGEKVIIV
jgi:hypothetical protein